MKKRNHIGFLTVIPPLEEALEHQEIFTFKAAMKSEHKKNFIQAIEHGIKNHASRKHWKYLSMNEVPHDQMIRSTLSFCIKHI